MSHRLFLVLGCNGKVDGEFMSCASVENVVLELSPQLEQIKDIITYLKALRLFETKLQDYNAARRVLFNIKEKYYQGYKPILDEQYFKLIEKFTINHKECGIYLSIVKKQ
jgi:hypothetical protein